MFTNHTGGSTHTIDWQGQFATSTTPPLTQIFEPFRAAIVFLFDVIPDLQIGCQSLVRFFYPQGDIRFVIFGHGQPGNGDGDGRRRGGQGGGEQPGADERAEGADPTQR